MRRSPVKVEGVAYSDLSWNGLSVDYLDDDPAFVGGVYFFQAENNGPIKIGWSRGDPKRRLRDVQGNSPVLLTLIARIEFTTVTLETHLHRAFKAERLHREWFTPSDRLLKWIDRFGQDPNVPTGCQKRIFFR